MSSSKALKFVKMHGLGNDFIVLDALKAKLPPIKKLAKQMCDRRAGIGADQILVLVASKKADFGMQIFNADGSEVEMCGNGLRCLAKFIIDNKLSKKTELTIETASGIQKITALPKNLFTVNMGEPALRAPEIPVKLNGRVINRTIRIEGGEFRVTCVNMGNPHCVLFIDDLENYGVAKTGAMIERSKLFPKKTNVEFVKLVDDNTIEMRVWERGAGETLACGSGACAAVVASVLNGYTKRKVRVKLAMGHLDIEWDRESHHVLMTGPAETVFEGSIEV